MLNIILTGHGNFATGLESSAKLIAGGLEAFYAIDFVDGDSTDDLEKKYKQIIDNNDGEFLFLTDLLGGSPFKTASILSTQYEDKKIYVVSGTNLGMVLELGLARPDSDILNTAMETGKNAIQCFSINNTKKDEIDEDGI